MRIGVKYNDKKMTLDGIADSRNLVNISKEIFNISNLSFKDLDLTEEYKLENNMSFDLVPKGVLEETKDKGSFSIRRTVMDKEHHLYENFYKELSLQKPNWEMLTNCLQSVTEIDINVESSPLMWNNLDACLKQHSPLSVTEIDTNVESSLFMWNNLDTCLKQHSPLQALKISCFSFIQMPAISFDLSALHTLNLHGIKNDDDSVLFLVNFIESLAKNSDIQYKIHFGFPDKICTPDQDLILKSLFKIPLQEINLGFAFSPFGLELLRKHSETLKKVTFYFNKLDILSQGLEILANCRNLRDLGLYHGYGDIGRSSANIQKVGRSLLKVFQDCPLEKYSNDGFSLLDSDFFEKLATLEDGKKLFKLKKLNFSLQDQSCFKPHVCVPKQFLALINVLSRCPRLSFLALPFNNKFDINSMLALVSALHSSLSSLKTLELRLAKGAEECFFSAIRDLTLRSLRIWGGIMLPAEQLSLNGSIIELKSTLGPEPDYKRIEQPQLYLSRNRALRWVAKKLLQKFKENIIYPTVLVPLILEYAGQKFVYGQFANFIALFFAQAIQHIGAKSWDLSLPGTDYELIFDTADKAKQSVIKTITFFSENNLNKLNPVVKENTVSVHIEPERMYGLMGFGV